MADNEQQPPRSKRDRIERLRKRVDDAVWSGSLEKLAAVLKGVLDLLADEL